MSPSARRIVPLSFEYFYTIGQAEGHYYRLLPNYVRVPVEPDQQRTLRERMHSKICPCCGARLSEVHRYRWGDKYCDPMVVYTACDQCGFFTKGVWDSLFGNMRTDVAFAKSFDASREAPALSHLYSVVCANSHLLYAMNPRNFEIFVGSVLKDFFSCEVYHVAGPGDDGVDLLAVVSDRPILIQVKRRRDDRRVEGIDVVKLLFASAYGRRADSGMVVTTARSFSKPAREWVTASGLKERGFRMRLVDINGLMSMVEAVRPSNAMPPWQAHQASELRRDDLATWKRWDFTDGVGVFHTTNDAEMLFLWRESVFDACYYMIGDVGQLSVLNAQVASVEDILMTLRARATNVAYLVNDEYYAQLSTIPEAMLDVIASYWRGDANDETYLTLAEFDEDDSVRRPLPATVAMRPSFVIAFAIALIAAL